MTDQNLAYTEVVECGVGQPTSGDIFGQLIEHLGILHDWVKKDEIFFLKSTCMVCALECKCLVYFESGTHMHSQNAPW